MIAVIIQSSSSGIMYTDSQSHSVQEIDRGPAEIEGTGSSLTDTFLLISGCAPRGRREKEMYYNVP